MKTGGDANEGTKETLESTTHDDQITDQEVVNKDILGVTEDGQLLEELNGKENEDKSAKKDDGPSSQARIQKVMPSLLQNEDMKNYFKPREISIGPIHAGDSDLLKRELKIKLAKKFITGSSKTPVSFLTEIKNNIQDLKAYFGKGVIPDRYNDHDDSLARLLFLDGCAVLQFIRSCVLDKLEEFEINSTQAALIEQDLFLFENQIPFKVLTLLMGVIDKGSIKENVEQMSFYFKRAIIQFIHDNNICAKNNPFNYYSRRDYHQMIGVLYRKKPVHLLDLLRMVSIFGSIKDVDVDEEERDNRNFLLNVCDQPIKNCLSSMANCFGKNWSCFTDELDEHEWTEERSLRSVQELKSSGITMKLSNSRSLKSVSFCTHLLGIFGHLKLPALKVNDPTIRKLWNLVAYETCLDNKGRYYSVTSYINFLDLLIDTEHDVKDLRTARILRNALGSDAKVAEFFNTLRLTYLPKFDKDHFEKIHFKIEEHYAKKCKIRMAQIYIDYLRNPWPTLGFFLAPAALLLTVVQTWYAIHPRGS